MKNLVIICIVCGIFAAFTVKEPRVVEKNTKEFPNNAYKVGEELNFLMYYGIINIGRASITLREFPTNDSRTIYHAKAEARTVGLTRMFTSLHHIYESYFNEYDVKPIKAIRNVKENNYSAYDEAVFDHETNRVKSNKSGIVEVPEDIYDIISSIYYLRRQGFEGVEINDTIKLTTFFLDKVFDYQIVYKGTERISTRLGSFQALKFQPVVEPGRSFQSEDGMRFWLSADNGHVPLRVEFDLRIGALKCDLVGHKNLKNELTRARR